MLAAGFARTVAAGAYAPAALTESPTMADAEDGIAATMKHADSGEFEVNRFKGLGRADAVAMAKNKYAELKVKYKGVTLPEDFKATDKMLGRDITAMVMEPRGAHMANMNQPHPPHKGAMSPLHCISKQAK